MIRLSLVIPFYGVEKYIGECLDSIYRQNIPETEYEVICVDDCSPDNSEEIVLAAQSNHKNLRLIRHETNKKLGAARNTGLVAAVGEYVWFIDSDDYIRDYCLRELIEECEKSDLDILHWSIMDNGGHWTKRIDTSDITTGIDDVISGSRDVTYPWNRLYKRTFLLENGLWFNDLWGGDVIHTIQALNVAQRTKGISDCYYYYRTDNQTSDMHSPGTATKVVSFSYILGRAIRDVSSQFDPRFQPLVAEWVQWRVNKSFKSILKLPFNEKKQFYALLRQDQELKDFAMQIADWKVKTVISCPFVVFLAHPFVMGAMYLKGR